MNSKLLCSVAPAVTAVIFNITAEGADVAPEVLRDLAGQHPGSPRLALAQRLVARAIALSMARQTQRKRPIRRPAAHGPERIPR